jgi:hypothetical protein
VSINLVQKLGIHPREQKIILPSSPQDYHSPSGSAPAILLLALVAPFSLSSPSFPRFLFVVASVDFPVGVLLSLSVCTAVCFVGAFFLDAAGVPLDFAARLKGLDTAGPAAGFATGFLIRFAGAALGAGSGVGSTAEFWLLVLANSAEAGAATSVVLRLVFVRFGAGLTVDWMAAGSGVGSTVAVLTLVLVSRIGVEPNSLSSSAPSGLAPGSLFLLAGSGVTV